MGQTPKYRLQQLKAEKRKAKAARKRKENTRSKIVRFLIVCEGTKTEPSYFQSLVKDKYSIVRKEKIIGQGRSTCSLVKKAKRIIEDYKDKSYLSFDRIWIVFDKDENNDFNEAIKLCESYSFNSAWSNESIELWFLLHFQYIESRIDRKSYITKLEEEIRKNSGHENFKYQKNDSSIYRLLITLGDEQKAKTFAARLRSKFKGNSDYKNHKPCTTVDLLVNELENPENVLSKINSR